MTDTTTANAIDAYAATRRAASTAFGLDPDAEEAAYAAHLAYRAAYRDAANAYEVTIDAARAIRDAAYVAADRARDAAINAYR